jgi:hypothetical protein
MNAPLCRGHAADRWFAGIFALKAAHGGGAPYTAMLE